MGLEWRENLSVGNDLIDTDHKHLIDIINHAETALKAKSRSKLTAVIDSLTRYPKVHFSNEERIALAAGYPETAHLHESHDGPHHTVCMARHKSAQALALSALVRNNILGW